MQPQAVELGKMLMKYHILAVGGIVQSRSVIGRG